jgi:hypothetical protein
MIALFKAVFGTAVGVNGFLFAELAAAACSIAMGFAGEAASNWALPKIRHVATISEPDDERLAFNLDERKAADRPQNGPTNSLEAHPPSTAFPG